MNELLMFEAIGWIGGILLTLCGVPQAYQSIKTGVSTGLNMWFIQMWMWGEVLLLIYVFPKGHLPLTINYAFNIIIVGIILWYKVYPRKEKRRRLDE